jgi:hypothetical protein
MERRINAIYVFIGYSANVACGHFSRAYVNITRYYSRRPLLLPSFVLSNAATVRAIAVNYTVSANVLVFDGTPCGVIGQHKAAIFALSGCRMSLAKIFEDVCLAGIALKSDLTGSAAQLWL